MVSYKEILEKAKNKKGEYIILYERLDNYGLWNKEYELHTDKDLAIDCYNDLLDERNQKDYKNIRFICPINMEPVLHLMKVSKQLEANKEVTP